MEDGGAGEGGLEMDEAAMLAIVIARVMVMVMVVVIAMLNGNERRMMVLVFALRVNGASFSFGIARRK